MTAKAVNPGKETVRWQVVVVATQVVLLASSMEATVSADPIPAPAVRTAHPKTIRARDVGAYISTCSILIGLLSFWEAYNRVFNSGVDFWYFRGVTNWHVVLVKLLVEFFNCGVFLNRSRASRAILMFIGLDKTSAKKVKVANHFGYLRKFGIRFESCWRPSQ